MLISTPCTPPVRRSETVFKRSDDQLAPTKGIVLGCVIGAGLWAGIIALTGM